MTQVPQFVPSSKCLSCDGCCRFAQQRSPWSPLFLFQEIEDLVQKDLLPSAIFSATQALTGQASRIDLEASGDAWVCPCLDPKNVCRIYSHRPLECRLYPFLLVSHEGKKVLAADTHCPYLSEHFLKEEGRDFVLRLKEFFSSKEMKRVLQENDSLFQDYPQGYQVLFSFSDI